MVWFQFAVCVFVISVAGVRLTRYGDVIAYKSGLGGNWIGIVLLATVTSLPELVNGISSVTFADAPDIAAGDILGSCVFNLALIVVVDFMYRPAPVYSKANQGHILSAAFGVLLIGITGFNILLSAQGNTLRFFHIGLYTPIIMVFYFIAMRTVFRYEKTQMAKFTVLEEDQYPGLTLQRAIIRFVIAASLVVVAGSFLPFIGKAIAQQMGWYESFVGTLLIAATTSLPELVVTVAALRLGAVDMAIADLFGSNLFDICILAIDDLLYLKGPLFEHVSPAHAVSAFSAMMMTGVVIVGLFYRPQTRVFKLVGWVSIFLFCIYLLNSYVLYLYGH
jgi:cation:H+ antiporter